MPLRGGTSSDCDVPSVFTQAVYRGPLRTRLLGQSGQTAYRVFPAFARGKLNTTTREPSWSRGAPLYQGLEGGLPRVRPASGRGAQGRPAREHASPRPGLGEPYTTPLRTSQGSIPNDGRMCDGQHTPKGLCRRGWWASRDRLRAQTAAEKPSCPCLPFFQPYLRAQDSTFIMTSLL